MKKIFLFTVLLSFAFVALASASILLVSKSKHTSVTLARAGELDA